MKSSAEVLITAEQSRNARRRLGLTQREVIKQGKLSGYKLKQHESGFAAPEGIEPFLRQLRSFYERRGIQFDADDNDDESAVPAGKRISVRREAMFLCDELSDAKKDLIYARLEANREELQRTADMPATRDFFDDFDGVTNDRRDRAIDLLEEQAVLYAMLFGQCAFAIPTKQLLDSPETALTVGDVLSLQFAGLFRESGLQQQEPAPSAPAVPAEASNPPEDARETAAPGHDDWEPF